MTTDFKYFGLISVRLYSRSHITFLTPSIRQTNLRITVATENTNDAYRYGYCIIFPGDTFIHIFVQIILHSLPSELWAPGKCGAIIETQLRCIGLSDRLSHSNTSQSNCTLEALKIIRVMWGWLHGLNKVWQLPFNTDK